jgi:hypothetical protein
VEKKPKVQMKQNGIYLDLKNSYNTHRLYYKFETKLDNNEKDEDEYGSMMKMNQNEKNIDKDHYKSHNNCSIDKNNNFYNNFFENFEFNSNEKENQDIINKINLDKEKLNSLDDCKTDDEEDEYGNIDFKNTMGNLQDNVIDNNDHRIRKFNGNILDNYNTNTDINDNNDNNLYNDDYDEYSGITKEYNQDYIADNTYNEYNNIQDEKQMETNSNNIDEKHKIENIYSSKKSILKNKNNSNKKKRSKITTLQNYEISNSSNCIGDLESNEKRNIFEHEIEEKQNRRFESIYDKIDENNSSCDDNNFSPKRETRVRRKITIYSEDDEGLDKDIKTNKDESQKEEEIDGLCSSRSSRSRKQTMERIDRKSYNENPSDNNNDINMYELSNKIDDSNYNLNLISNSGSKINDNQYFMDNDQMLGRDITEYKPNQVIAKTEEELLDDLEKLVQNINEGYKCIDCNTGIKHKCYKHQGGNSQTLEECSKILCKYFKSSIINHSQNNIFLNNDKNLTNLNQGSLIEDSSKLSMNNLTNISSNNAFTGGGSSLFIHKLKYLKKKHKAQKNSDKILSNNNNRNKNVLNSNSKRNTEDYEVRSLSCNSICDINFKNVIDTIISFNKNKKNNNDNSNINESCKFNKNLNHVTYSNDINFLKENKDLEYNDSFCNSLKQNSYHSYQSNVSKSNNDNSKKIINIGEIISENLQISENIKMMLLGDTISKAQFFKALKYGENLTFEEMESSNLENDKQQYPR